MTLSVAMNTALLSLIDINNQISTVSDQLQSGKRFNSAADGAVQWLQITDFTNRASSLTTINDSLSVALSQTKGASTTLSDIRSKLVSTQTSLNDAYTSQAAVHGTAATTDTVTNETATQFKFNLALDPNSQQTSFNGQTTLDGNILINNSRVHSGDEFTVGVNSNGSSSSVTFKIAPDSATVDATSQKALDTLTAKQAADISALGTAGDGTNGTGAIGEQQIADSDKTNALFRLNPANNVGVPGYTNNIANPVGNNLLVPNTQVNGFATVSIALAQAITNLNNAPLIAAGQTPTFTVGTLTLQGYVDGLRALATKAGDPNQVAAANALNGLYTLQQSGNANMAKMANYAVAMREEDTAIADVAKYTKAVGADGKGGDDAAAIAALSATLQKGTTDKPYLVATVKDFMNTLTNLKDTNGNTLFSFSQATPDDYSAITSYSATGTAQGALSLTRVATGNASDVSDVRNLFASVFDTTATDTTKAYDISNWQNNGNTYTLTNVHHTGSTPGSVTTAADTKRKVAANTFRQMLKDIDQAVKDTALNGVNLLTGSKLSVALNADGDKFDFQLTNADGSAATFKSSGLGLDATAANINDAAGSTNNNFDNNTDMDTALTQITNALATVDTASGLVGDAQNSLQNRTDFNKSMIDLLNSTSSSLSSVDTNAAAAQLAALQTRQQFASSIMSIVKQNEQSPLQLLR